MVVQTTDFLIHRADLERPTSTTTDPYGDAITTMSPHLTNIACCFSTDSAAGRHGLMVEPDRERIADQGALLVADEIDVQVGDEVVALRDEQSTTFSSDRWQVRAVITRPPGWGKTLTLVRK